MGNLNLYQKNSHLFKCLFILLHHNNQKLKTMEKKHAVEIDRLKISFFVICFCFSLGFYYLFRSSYSFFNLLKLKIHERNALFIARATLNHILAYIPIPARKPLKIVFADSFNQNQIQRGRGLIIQSILKNC